MTSGPETGQLPKFLPNPHETIKPTSGREALEDAVRFMGTLMPRAEVRRLIEEMDPAKVMLTVQGVKADDYVLSAVELHIGTTVDWCAREGLLESPISAIGAMVGVRQEVLDGGVFVGEESQVVEA
jgi:hypothetical protein